MKHLACLVFASVLTASCSHPGGVFQSSPSDVVRAFYAACNAGKYSEAEKYLAPETREFVKGGLGALAGGLQGYCDDQTKKGTLQKAEILKQDVRGEGAEVRFKLYYRDGSSKEYGESMIKKDGAWKVGIGRFGQ